MNCRLRVCTLFAILLTCGLPGLMFSAAVTTADIGPPSVSSFAVGSLPNGVVFDGSNIWVANGGSNNVMKLRKTDGAVLAWISTDKNSAKI
jgi:hypothetical protein